MTSLWISLSENSGFTVFQNFLLSVILVIFRLAKKNFFRLPEEIYVVVSLRIKLFLTSLFSP